MNSTFDWLRIIDRHLYDLKETKLDVDKMTEHFEVKEIFENRDKFYDLVNDPLTNIINYVEDETNED